MRVPLPGGRSDSATSHSDVMLVSRSYVMTRARRGMGWMVGFRSAPGVSQSGAAKTGLGDLAIRTREALKAKKKNLYVPEVSMGMSFGCGSSSCHKVSMNKTTKIIPEKQDAQ